MPCAWGSTAAAGADRRGGEMARRVEVELVLDRLAAARLAQAYSILAPECRRLSAGNERARESGDARGKAGTDALGGNLRPRLHRSPAGGRDRREPDQRVA